MTPQQIMSYQEEQIFQNEYCDNCFSQFTCSNCSYYTFPCLNCEFYGHVCSINCEPLPVYPGPKFPPGLPIPPVYDSLFETTESEFQDTVTESDTEFHSETNSCDNCLECDFICMYDEFKNSCYNCVECGLICYNDN